MVLGLYLTHSEPQTRMTASYSWGGSLACLLLCQSRSDSFRFPLTSLFFSRTTYSGGNIAPAVPHRTRYCLATSIHLFVEIVELVTALCSLQYLYWVGAVVEYACFPACLKRRLKGRTCTVTKLYLNFAWTLTVFETVFILHGTFQSDWQYLSCVYNIFLMLCRDLNLNLNQSNQSLFPQFSVPK